jgi:hypothetical protein
LPAGRASVREPRPVSTASPRKEAEYWCGAAWPGIFLLAFSLLLGLFLPGGVGIAAEQPSIRVQPVAPGSIAISYYHSGTGDVLGCIATTR